jgi:hypothetical protein
MLEALVALFLVELVGVSKTPWQKGADAGIRTCGPANDE